MSSENSIPPQPDFPLQPGGQSTRPLNLYLIGGFLGSGKTTAISQACQELRANGPLARVISNDLGSQQVDEAFFKGLFLPLGAVSGGCFCCRYEEFEHQLFQIQKGPNPPEIIFAEPVGSCTDLVATLARPLTLRQPRIRVMVNVLADASLLLGIFRGETFFSREDIRYLYQKQLAEADLILLTKIDLLQAGELAEVKQNLRTAYPEKRVFLLDAYNPAMVRQWLALMKLWEQPKRRGSLDLDYDRYAAAEARLSWLDASLALHTSGPEAVPIARQLAASLYVQFKQAGLEIGHLKFLLKDGDWQEKISYTGGANPDSPPREHACCQLEMLVNARILGSPEQLKEIFSGALAQLPPATGFKVMRGTTEAFTPEYPRPTHRIY